MLIKKSHRAAHLMVEREGPRRAYIEGVLIKCVLKKRFHCIWPSHLPCEMRQTPIDGIPILPQSSDLIAIMHTLPIS